MRFIYFYTAISGLLLGFAIAFLIDAKISHADESFSRCTTYFSLPPITVCEYEKEVCVVQADHIECTQK